MKNKFKLIGILLLIILVIATALLLLYPKKIVSYIVPDIQEVNDIQVKIKNDTAFIGLKLIARNKSFLTIKIDTIKYKISLFNKPYLENQQPLKLLLSAYEIDTINFSLKVPYASILKDLKLERKKGDSTSYSLTIFLQYSTILGKAELPINKSAKLKIPQPPDFEVVHISYQKVRFTYVLANVSIKVSNFNDLKLIVKNLDYSLDISQQGNLKGTYEKEITIKPRGETYIDFPVEINLKNIGRTVWDVIRNKDNYHYMLTINALLKTPNVNQQSFRINLTKEGFMELRK